MQTVKPRARPIRFFRAEGVAYKVSHWIVHGDFVERDGRTLDEALRKWNHRVTQRKIEDATRAQA